MCQTVVHLQDHLGCPINTGNMVCPTTGNVMVCMECPISSGHFQ